MGLVLSQDALSPARVALTCDNLFAVLHEAGEPEVGSVLAAGHLLQAGQGSAGLGVLELLQVSRQAANR